jgi:hypothetical protein
MKKRNRAQEKENIIDRRARAQKNILEKERDWR